MRVPMRVVFIDKLPRNEMGKIERLVLKQQLIMARAGKLQPPCLTDCVRGTTARLRGRLSEVRRSRPARHL